MAGAKALNLNGDMAWCGQSWWYVELVEYWIILEMICDCEKTNTYIEDVAE